MTQTPTTQIDIPPRTSAAAITALVLGILALVGSCFVVGGVLGAAAVIVGLIAMAGIGKSSGQRKGKGLALAGVITGAIAIPLAAGSVFVMSEALRSARDEARHVTEASHLRQIGIAMSIYAAENRDALPTSPDVLVEYLGDASLFISPHNTSPAGPPQARPLSGEPGWIMGDYVFPMTYERIDDPAMPDASDAVVAFGTYMHPRDRTHNVLFLDGHVERVEAGRLDTLVPGPAE